MTTTTSTPGEPLAVPSAPSAPPAEPHTQNPILSKPLLTLPNGITVRPFLHSDIDASIKHLNNKNVRKYLRNVIPFPYTVADAEWWIAHTHDVSTWIASGPWKDPAIAATARESEEAAEVTAETITPSTLVPTQYAIATSDGQLIGAIGLAVKNDVYFRCAEVGYWLAEPFWGKGIMGSVCSPFVSWVFDTIGVLWRVEAQVDARNKPSRRCLERAGLVYEGTRRGFTWKEGKAWDEDILGRVRERELE